jgi:hypothetical protein
MRHLLARDLRPLGVVVLCIAPMASAPACAVDDDKKEEEENDEEDDA